jgi:DNA-3-methyladenine glycosylase I
MADKKRCRWSAGGSELMVRYHDQEWGVPVHDDKKHFEFLVLEGAQAGLSWNIILNKREGYRKAFGGFDWKKIARYGPKDVARLLADPGIVRNRLKVASVITNASAFETVRQEFGSFDAYVWPFVDGKPKVNKWRRMSEVPASTPESDALSKDLKKRGFKFVGTTIIYAHMQATGLVNDHEVTCFRYKAVAP